MFSSNKIQSPLRTQKENRGLTDESPDSKSRHLFPAAFSPCSNNKIQSPLKKQSKNDGKPEIYDFVGAPLPRRLERCGRLLRRQSFQTFTADGKPEIYDFAGAPLPERLGSGTEAQTIKFVVPPPQSLVVILKL
ncbi:hypothetical protein A0O21_04215 [Streptococcus pantholopis]|uniref:Uncharacterized protein n=1 Tax=Streptococcus pantholopis TaxID=1811193 RepID=A0A172Q749_9STRE|nr:hypothetical protein A0O21_04215 [Streptococcus pantholopis]